MSTEPEINSKWNKLLSFPFTSFSQPLVLNNDQFIVVSSNKSLSDGDGIYQFNTHKNEWTKIFDYDKNFKCAPYSAAYDNKHKLLYISDMSQYPPNMLTFDLKTRNKVTSKVQQYLVCFGLIFVEHKLHQICYHDGNHYIYDKTKQFQKITTFKSLKNLFCHGWIYLKQKKTVLLFGGISESGNQNSIYGFTCIDSKWKELNVKIPIKLFAFGLVATKNEQYIIIFGGATDGNNKFYFSDDIFIYNVRKNIFTKSKMKCPKKSKYYAIMINNSKRDEITSFGFVNDCYKEENLVGIQLLPQYLIKIICCYFCNEKVYLLKIGTGEHWKINVDHILQ